MAVEQQHSQFRHHESHEISAAVAQEDPPGRKVPDEEAEQRAHAAQRRQQDELVAHAIRHIGNRGEHHHADHRRQAVEAVDDVDRIRDAGDREDGQRNRDDPKCEQRVHDDDVGAIDHRIQHHGAEEGRQGCRQQALARTDGQRDVFCQPVRHRGEAACDQQHHLVFHRSAPAHVDGAGSKSRKNADAAQARHGLVMEFLRAAEVAVRAPHHSIVGLAHEEERNYERNCRRC